MLLPLPGQRSILTSDFLFRKTEIPYIRMQAKLGSAQSYLHDNLCKINGSGDKSFGVELILK
jgi:hypothetical protein